MRDSFRIGQRVVRKSDASDHGEVVALNGAYVTVQVAPGKRVTLLDREWTVRAHVGGIGVRPDALRSNGLGGTVARKATVSTGTAKAVAKSEANRLTIDADGRIVSEKALPETVRLAELRAAQRGKRVFWFYDKAGKLQGSEL